MNPLYPVELLKDKKGHRYKVNDLIFPGVTGVLDIINKKAIGPWMVKKCAEYTQDYLLKNALERPLTKEEVETLTKDSKRAYKTTSTTALDIGTRAHAAINDIIEGREPVITDDIRNPVDGFKEFVDKERIKIIKGDTKVASLLFEYGGSLDAVAFKQGKVIIIDFKTSKGIYPEYALQAGGAYTQAFKETFGLDYLPDAMILRVGKDVAEFEVRRVKSTQRAFEAFKSALDLYRSLQMEMYEDQFYYSKPKKENINETNKENNGV